MRRIVFAVLAAALLTGCEAGVQTRVDVESAEESTIVSTVRFTDEAAAQLAGNDELDRQLRELIENRTGREAERDGDETELSYRVELTYEELLAAQDVLGISAASLEGASEDDVTLRLTLAPPSGLNEAIIAATTTQPDAEALAETMLRTTTVDVEVVFDGGIETVSGTYELVPDGESVILSQSLAMYQEGQLNVQGDPQRSFLAAYGYILAIGAGVLVLLFLVVLSRRRALRGR